jgi:cysteine/O-acetylserine efflux protein
VYGIPIVAALAFVVAATFSPGPNNIMSATLGLMQGYRKTLPFLFGIVGGFSTLLLASAAASSALLGAVPAIESIMRWVGATYILWLAWMTWVRRRSFGASTSDEVPPSHGFVGGFALQFVNAKALVFAIMMFTTFLAGIARQPFALAVSVGVLAALTFTSTSLWALGGMAIRLWLKKPRDQAILAAVLALTLVYTAIELVVSGVGRWP